MSKVEYTTGLEFLNEGPYAERAREVKEMCEQLGEDIKMSVLDGETLAYMLMEMYNRGRNEGATAALIHQEPTPQEIH
jgi:hypothetical protein